MPATVIVGLQWGDEGKGKTTDFLAEQVAMVVRYQGGDNAGHTVVVGSEKMVLYDDGDKEPVRIFDQGVVYRDPETFGEYQLSYRTGDIISPRVDTTEPIIAELHGFLEAIRTGEDPNDLLRIARDVVSMIEAAEASLAEGGRQQLLPTSDPVSREA